MDFQNNPVIVGRLQKWKIDDPDVQGVMQIKKRGEAKTPEEQWYEGTALLKANGNSIWTKFIGQGVQALNILKEMSKFEPEKKYAVGGTAITGFGFGFPTLTEYIKNGQPYRQVVCRVQPFNSDKERKSNRSEAQMLLWETENHEENAKIGLYSDLLHLNIHGQNGESTILSVTYNTYNKNNTNKPLTREEVIFNELEIIKNKADKSKFTESQRINFKKYYQRFNELVQNNEKATLNDFEEVIIWFQSLKWNIQNINILTIDVAPEKLDTINELIGKNCFISCEIINQYLAGLDINGMPQGKTENQLKFSFANTENFKPEEFCKNTVNNLDDWNNW